MVEIKVVFSLKIFCLNPIHQILTADFERVSNVCALVWLTKIPNVWFRLVIEFTFSYAIQEKFTARRVDSTLNFS